MWLGLLLTVGTAVCWTGVAVGYQRAGRRGTPLAPLIFVVASAAAVMSLGGVNWPAVLGGACRQTATLAPVMGISGVFNQTGMLLLPRGMRSGHPAVAWVIGQSAIVFPVAVVGSILAFSLYAGLVLKQRLTARMWAGVGCGMIGIGLLALRH